MKLKILNFRGISNAEIETNHITLLAGQNRQGKTSTMQAAATVLTESIYPISGLTKKDCGKIIHGENKKAYLSAEFENGSVSMLYPDLKRTAQGEPSEISGYAAGLIDLTSMKPAGRISAITDILNTHPTIDLLKSELAKIKNLSSDKLDQLIKTVESNGWDAAHKLAKTSRTQLTGAWENVTGERFGSAKSDGWRPATWDMGFESLTVEQLTERLTEEREWLQAATSQDAVDAQELNRLTKEAQGLEDYKSESDDLTHQLNGLLSKSSEIKTEISKLRSESQSKNAYECPGCGESLVLKGGVLEKHTPPTDEEKTANVKKIEKLTDHENKITREMADKSDKLIQNKAAIKAAESAIKRLAEMKGKPEADIQKIGDLKNRVRVAEERLEAKKAVERADLICKKYVDSAKVIDILSPEGLRKSCAKKALDTFNEYLMGLASRSGWPPVDITDDADILVDRREFKYCSESEQFRCRVMIQYAMACIQKSEYVLIDGADILDVSGLNGLFAIARGFTGRSIVAMTIKKDTVPNLEKIGGVAYWIESGTAVKL